MKTTSDSANQKAYPEFWGRDLNIAGILVHGTSLMLIGEVCVKMFSAFVSISLSVFRRPFNQIAGYFLVSMLSRGGA